jgi:hypothetical protein
MVRRYIAKYWDGRRRIKDIISDSEEEEEEEEEEEDDDDDDYDSKASHLIKNCWSESVTLKKKKKSSETI